MLVSLVVLVLVVFVGAVVRVIPMFEHRHHIRTSPMESTVFQNWPFISFRQKGFHRVPKLGFSIIGWRLLSPRFVLSTGLAFIVSRRWGRPQAQGVLQVPTIVFLPCVFCFVVAAGSSSLLPLPLRLSLRRPLRLGVNLV